MPILLLFVTLLTVSCVSSPDSDHAEMYNAFVARQDFLELGETGPEGERLALAYTDVGPRSAEAILLVHGVPTSSWVYRSIIPLLVAEGYRVVAPDNLGFGSSSKPESPEYYGHAVQGARLLELMDHLGIDRWHQVPHDVGGPITWEMIDRRPESIASLTILNTVAYPEGFHPPRSLDNPVVRFSMGLIGFDDRPVIRNVICAMVEDPEQLDTPRNLEGYYRPLLDGGDYAYLHFLRNLDDTRAQFSRYAEIIGEYEGPAQIIWGAHDDVLQWNTAVPRFRESLQIPPSRVHILDSAKHLVQEEQPALIAGQIAALLRE